MLKTEKQKRFMESWGKEKEMKLITCSFKPYPFHEFGNGISRFQNVYKAIYLTKQKEKYEVFFCFGTEILGGFSNF